MNLNRQTGRFYDVTGSVGLKNAGHSTTTYANSNPFLFTGRMVVRTGPQEYEIYDGTLTTCQLPDPDWMLYSGKFTVDSEKAKAQNSIFRSDEHSAAVSAVCDASGGSGRRQSGFLIPVPGYSSTKGFIFGEQYYWAINRSTDLTVGAQYYSLRGWEQSASFRYRGLGNDFAKAHYSGLLDRGIMTNGVYVNQGGEDVTFSGRHDFSPKTRVVADAEYLSSYAYREAFAENFSLAVSSDILSIVYGVHEADGYAESARADRYQGLKHGGDACDADDAGDTGGTGANLSCAIAGLQSARSMRSAGAGCSGAWKRRMAGLSRVQPDFSTGGLTQRLDIHPEIAYPLSFGGWRLRPSVGFRETAYSRSRQTPYPRRPPVELPNATEPRRCGG